MDGNNMKIGMESPAGNNTSTNNTTSEDNVRNENNKRSRTSSLLSLLMQQETTTTKSLRRKRCESSNRMNSSNFSIVTGDDQLVGINSKNTGSSSDNDEEKSSCCDDECCFICMSSFTKKHPKMRIPCSNQCNRTPVHGKCIYEWKESKQCSSCPLCRGPLNEVDYTPLDKIGSHRFLGNFHAKKDFITRPVSKEAGMVRCYVRAIRPEPGSSASTRYELYLQAPTTLAYPLGPLPSLDGSPKKGDILLAVSHKHINRWGCGQLDITMDPKGLDFQLNGENFLGCVCSSYTGLEHTIIVPTKNQHQQQQTGGKPGMSEIGAVRYTQNRIGRAVGPRRIHVCFPNVEQHEQDVVPVEAKQLEEILAQKYDEEDDDDVVISKNEWVTSTYQPANKQESLSSILRTVSQANNEANTTSSSNTEQDEQLASSLIQSKKLLLGANKTPYWLLAINAFSLDFGGRVTLPSNKNFQLIVNTEENQSLQEQDISLQFGKVAENRDVEVFTMDLAWPLSPLQAFATCLSATERKLMCA